MQETVSMYLILKSIDPASLDPNEAETGRGGFIPASLSLKLLFCHSGADSDSNPRPSLRPQSQDHRHLQDGAGTRSEWGRGRSGWTGQCPLRPQGSVHRPRPITAQGRTGWCSQLLPFFFTDENLDFLNVKSPDF